MQVEFYQQFSGFLSGDYMAGAMSFGVALILLAGYFGAPLLVWTIIVGALLIGFGAPAWLFAVFLLVVVISNVRVLRKMIFSAPVMSVFKSMGLIPKISETERTALEAGVVWSEAELFSGAPNFKKLLNEPYPELTAEEKAFLDGPVEQLCGMLDDWQIYKERQLPNKAFEFIKDQKFLGMIIPKEYGGLGFSAMAHSEVIGKLSTRSIAATITVMVPNSLGPAELLIHYGTESQKQKYLPRLATGQELPCFGLTEPQAGSDAGAITSEAVLFKGDDGELYLRLNWSKRWITLAAISTVIGLAFRLRDPENYLGQGEDLGITCALIPSDTPGVVLGRRHEPLTIPFYNCPTQGKDVVVKAEESIIGGLANAGKGWQMLMESLGAGRGVSLPAQCAGGCKQLVRVAGNHSVIRKQFGISIGKFEGVEEPLARIVGRAYLMEAMRRYTLSALDQGIKPPVVTAMAKFNATEIWRKSINDAMDVLGGTAISMGPKNVVAIPYIATPVVITVEGANILTRTLMIFGQGALRAHPYAFAEVNSIERNDLDGFDKAFWGHIGHIVRNSFRSVLLSLTRGYLFRRPLSGMPGRHAQKIAWASASFAIMADIAMGLLGGRLKQREMLTGRFADILSWMYIGTAVLRRYEAEGKRKEDLPVLDYCLRLAHSEIQKGFDGIFSNFDVPLVGWVFKGPIRWWSRLNNIATEPSDALTHEVASVCLRDSEQRDRLSEGVYLPKDLSESVAHSEATFKLIMESQFIERKIKKAIKKKQLPKARISQLLMQAREKDIISQDEYEILYSAERMRWEAIQVDDFSEEEYLPGPTAKPTVSKPQPELSKS